MTTVEFWGLGPGAIDSKVGAIHWDGQTAKADPPEDVAMQQLAADLNANPDKAPAMIEQMPQRYQSAYFRAIINPAVTAG